MMDMRTKWGTGKRRLILLAATMTVLISCVLAAGCGAQVSAAEMDFTFSSRDLDPGYDEASAVKIALADGGSAVTGTGVQVSGNTVTITEEGTYIVSGTLSDGQLVVDAGDSDKIQIVLRGVSIYCGDDAALSIKQADKVFVTLADGTQNTLTDGAARGDADGEESKVDGVIYSKADLTINGGGTLSVTGAYKHGIVSKDDLVITGGIISVTAEDQGLAGKDCVKIKDGTFTLNTKGDAIQSDNAEQETKGFIYICGGTFRITAEAGDGLQAETVLRVDGGTFAITTGGGSAQAAKQTGQGGMPGGRPGGRGAGNPGGGTVSGGAVQLVSGGAVQSETDTVSTKGLKAGAQLLVNGGTFTMDNLDDALHSNGSLSVTGGEITAATGDDGAHADGALLISGGTVKITESYEGIEGKTVAISGGTVDVTSSDDGFNAAGGSDETFPGGMSGQDSFDETDSDVFIEISGGTVTIDASGDGIDSNGDLTISGGTVTISGPANNGNGVLDYNGKALITGGTLMGTGNSGMAQGFSDSSTQYSVLYNLSSTVEAGGTVKILDEKGNQVLSWTADKQFNSVQFSSSRLVKGKTYTIQAGSQSEEVALDSMAVSNSNGGGMGGGGGRMPGGMGGGGGRPGHVNGGTGGGAAPTPK